MNNNKFKSVIDPDTGLTYHVNSKKGRKILKKYSDLIEQDGGMWPFGKSKEKSKGKKSSFFKRNKGKIAAAAATGLGLGIMALRKFSKKASLFSFLFSIKKRRLETSNLRIFLIGAVKFPNRFFLSNGVQNV